MKNLIILFTTFSLISCDYGYKYQYLVYNNTNDTLIIDCISIEDSNFSIVINPENEKLIYSASDHGGEGAHGPYDIDKDVLFDFESIQLSINDSIPNIDFTLRENWKFSTNENIGIYSLTIE